MSITTSEYIRLLAQENPCLGLPFVPPSLGKVFIWFTYPGYLCKNTMTFVSRLIVLNQETARSTVEDSVTGFKAVLGAKDAKEVFSIQSSLFQAAVEKALAYSRSVNDIAAQTQEELPTYFRLSSVKSLP